MDYASLASTSTGQRNRPPDQVAARAPSRRSVLSDIGSFGVSSGSIAPFSGPRPGLEPRNGVGTAQGRLLTSRARYGRRRLVTTASNDILVRARAPVFPGLLCHGPPVAGGGRAGRRGVLALSRECCALIGGETADDGVLCRGRVDWPASSSAIVDGRRSSMGGRSCRVAS